MIEQKSRKLTKLWRYFESLGAYSLHTKTDNEEIEIRMRIEDLLKLFDKKEICLKDFHDSDYPFDAVAKIENISFSSLLDTNDIKKYFPEEIKNVKNSIEVGGVKYIRED